MLLLIAQPWDLGAIPICVLALEYSYNKVELLSLATYKGSLNPKRKIYTVSLRKLEHGFRRIGARMSSTLP